MPNTSPLQLQWSLDHTSSGALSFTRDLIRAATSDNVQPLVLKVCERYGTTLPVHPDTRLKIEILAGRKHKTQLNWIKLFIGYSEGDAAAYLSDTDGGLRFLCLVAALGSVSNELVAARTLQNLIQNSSHDTLLPTTSQYLDLLRVLKPKLALSDFTNSVIGWASHFSPFDSRLLNYEGYRAPPGESIAELIIALSKFARIGEECSVYIRCTFHFCPWTVAFIKWLTGVPPRVQIGVKMALDEVNPSVFISICDFGTSWQVQIAQRFQDIKSLVWKSRVPQVMNTQLFEGLIEPSTWIKQRLLTHMHFQKCTQQDMLWLLQGLFFVIKYLPEKVLLDQGIDIATWRLPSVHKKVDGKHRGFAFPNCTTRLNITRLLLSDTSFGLTEVPDFDGWINRTKQICNGCNQCDVEKIMIDGVESSNHCPKALVGELAADILLLCLFPNTDATTTPKVSVRHSDLDRTLDENRDLRDTIRKISIQNMTLLDAEDWGLLVTYGWYDLLNNDISFLHYSSTGLFQSTLEMLGHESISFDEDPFDTVISESHGQVVFPTIFYADRPIQRGYLALEIFTGKLEWTEGRISRAVSPRQDRKAITYLDWDYWGWVHGCQDMNPNYTASTDQTPSLEYQILPTDHQLNVVEITFWNPDYWSDSLGLWNVIRGAGITIFAQACSHKEGSVGSLPMNFRILELPVLPYQQNPAHASTRVKGFYPVHGSGRWRLLSFAATYQAGGCTVFHHSGCLRCCAMICPHAKFHWLIC